MPICLQYEQKPLESRTTLTASKRFDLKFFHVFEKNRHPGKLHFAFVFH